MFKLRLINIKYSEKKSKYYVRKWLKISKYNPWVDVILTNIVRKTRIVDQISLWRMKINPKNKIIKMDPTRFVAAIQIKRFMTKIIGDHGAIFMWNL